MKKFLWNEMWSLDSGVIYYVGYGEFDPDIKVFNFDWFYTNTGATIESMKMHGNEMKDVFDIEDGRALIKKAFHLGD